MTATLAPGAFVRHPDRPDWGLGQVQSVIGDRATVNFEHAGKLLIDLRQVTLQAVRPCREESSAGPTSSGRS
jgi:hypothetical protein